MKWYTEGDDHSLLKLSRNSGGKPDDTHRKSCRIAIRPPDCVQPEYMCTVLDPLQSICERNNTAEAPLNPSLLYQSAQSLLRFPDGFSPNAQSSDWNPA
jgi:hypothetical protein